MRRLVSGTALAWLVLGAGLAGGQTRPAPGGPPGPANGKAPAKSGLEEALAEALKNNPDLRVELARFQKAEAELSRARLQVAQKVVAAYNSLQTARATAEESERRLASVERLGAARAVSAQERGQARSAVVKSKAEVASLEAELAYLQGKTPRPGESAEALERQRYWTRVALAQLALEQSRVIELVVRAKPLRGPVADKLRKALDRSVTLKFSDTPVEEALKALQKEATGVHIQVVKSPAFSGKVTANFTDLPLGAALELLEDALPNHRIVVREYGLLIAPQERVPPKAMLLHDFWKGGDKDKPATGGTSGVKNPPPGDVEGVVKKTDKNGLLVLSVGSTAGLAKGHTLEVYRLTPTPKYLGSVRVVDVTATEAVARPTGPHGNPIQVGDRVGSRLLRK